LESLHEVKSDNETTSGVVRWRYGNEYNGTGHIDRRKAHYDIQGLLVLGDQEPDKSVSLSSTPNDLPK
jgi:hypothetical protein